MQSGREKAFWLLLACALVVRAAAAFHPGALRSDPDGYRLLAENLVEHGQFGFDGVPTAYRPPLYPLLLTCCVVLGPAARVAIGCLHVALGVATVALSYRLARRLGLGDWALAAAALVAVDPILLAQSSQVMTETPATFLVAVALLLLIRAAEHPHRGLHVLVGATLGCVILCRANLIVWVPLAAAWAAWPTGRWLTKLQTLALTGLGFAVVLTPWVVRNQLRFGQPVAATTHGGYTLLLANNPWYYEHLRQHGWRTVWDADQFNRQWRARAGRAAPSDELRNQRQAYREALATIRSERGMFLLACGVRMADLWGVLPHQIDGDEPPLRTLSRWLVALWYSIQTALGVLGLVCLSRACRSSHKSFWQWGLGILLLVSLTAVHAVFWSNMRMRAPAVPVIAALAALGASSLAKRLLARKTSAIA